MAKQDIERVAEKTKLAQAVAQRFLIYETDEVYRCAYCNEEYQADEGQTARDVQIDLSHKKECVVVDAVRILAEEVKERAGTP